MLVLIGALGDITAFGRLYEEFDLDINKVCTVRLFDAPIIVL